MAKDVTPIRLWAPEGRSRRKQRWNLEFVNPVDFGLLGLHKFDDAPCIGVVEEPPTHADGWTLCTDGPSNSRDVKLEFWDNAGALRAGTLKSYGHVTPGANNTYDFGTAALSWRRLYLGDGSATAPSLEFGSDSDGTGTGIYKFLANRLGIAANGARVAVAMSGGLSAQNFCPNTAGVILNSPTFTQSYLRFDPAMSIQWASSNNGGGATVDLWLLRDAAGVLKIGAGLGSTTSWGEIQAILRATDGSVSAPSIGFKDDTDVGGFRIGANELGLVAGGSLGAGNYGFVRLSTSSFGPVLAGASAGAALNLGAAAERWARTYTTIMDTRSMYVDDATPAQITANQNNYALPSDATVVRLSADAVWDITGFVADTDRLYALVNVGVNRIRLREDDAGSTAGNRIYTANASFLAIDPNEAAWIWYDSTSAHWRVI